MPIGRNLPIGIKFTIGFYAVIAIMLGLVSFGYVRVQDMNNNSQEIVESATQIDSAMEMRLAVAGDLQAVTLLINARSLEQVENAWALHQAHVLSFNQFSGALLNGSMTSEGMIFRTRNPEIRSEVEKSILFHTTEFQARIRNIHEVMRGVAELNQWDMDPERRLRPIYREVNEEGWQLQSMITKLEKDMRAELKRAHERHNTLALTFASRAVPGMVLAVLFSLGFGFFVSSIMLRHISRMVRVADQVAAGELPENVDYPSSDEIGQLARSLNAMVASSRSIVEQANQIAAGNYAMVVTPRSDKDTLATSLNHMTSRLRLMTEATDRQQWFQGRLAELNETIRGEHNPAVLATHVLEHLATTLGIQIGALYTPDDESALRIIGSYALPDSDRQRARFMVGEGLVGQVALTKKHICVQNVPEDYFHMTSALGSRTPTTILVFPLLHDLQVVGVLELGTFEPFDDLKISFLERACRDIAVAISSAEHREQMKSLLEQTRRQAEELQIRQEELRQTNEELEEQASALRTSEERLQLQQEELRVVNEELEERNRTLEAQRDAIRKKNDELRIAQEDIEKKAKALDTASRYKSEFLANMSHELRTPLNSILILSQLLGENRNGTLTAKQLEFARTIHSSGTDLMTLINEVLDLSKIEAGKTEIQMEPVLLDEVLESAERTFRQVAVQKGLSFSIERDPGVPERIETDRQRFQQILSNLLSNAFKFTERGGVSVRAGRPAPGTALQESRLEPGSALSIAVTDTGIGISEDKQSLIFEAFQQADGTTSRQYGGTGLGLSISRELARLLGGEIALESRPGSGSTFVLYLPLTGKQAGASIQPELLKEAPPRPARPEPAQTPAKPSSIETVRDDRLNVRPEDKSLLIIEDDPTFSHVVVNLARDRNFKCLVAGDGETGLHFADYYRPKAIILDVGLPHMDGWTVMERLKDNPATRHIPVHFMSGFAKGSEALRLGAIGFLSKPVDLEQLDAAFTRIETIISKPVKKLLVVEDDEVQRRSIMELIGSGDVRSVAAGSGGEALEFLESEEFDCMILDLGLKDMSGIDLLAQIRTRRKLTRIPVVIYTGRDLTPEENAELEKFADSIIVKGAKSPQRLLDETTLFLHRVEADLPEEKQRMIRMLHQQDAPLSGKKILLVDDDMRNIFALSHVLEEQGMRVVMGKNGREGLRRLEQNPDVDLIIMDIMMPEMNGYEAMEAIRKIPAHADLPIIVLTAKAMKGDRARCIEHGASDYLAKPVDTDRLLSLLKVWLYGKGRT